MIKFKPKKIGQKFTYKNHLLIAKDSYCSNYCYMCAMRYLFKMAGDCRTIHKCGYNKMHFRDLGKLKRK